MAHFVFKCNKEDYLSLYTKTHTYMHMFWRSGYFPVDSNCQYVRTHVCMYVYMHMFF
jgi:hypothetical protein